MVIATRNSDGGSMGGFEGKRKRLSHWGRKLSYAVCRCELSDPMSGYFVIRRSFLMELVHRLRGNGFKILVDILFPAPERSALAKSVIRFATGCLARAS